MKVKILVWQRIPYEPGEEPGMPTYRIAGTAEYTTRTTAQPMLISRPFIGNVSVEIDGRDGDYEHVAGQRLDNEWEALMLAISENESLTAEMAAEAGKYFAGK